MLLLCVCSLKAREDQEKLLKLSDLIQACHLITNEGWTYQRVVDHFHFPLAKSTLHRYAHLAKQGHDITAPRGPGRRPILTPEEEAWLSQWIRFCCALGIPPRRGRVLRKAAQIAKLRGASFGTKSGLPSDKWWRGFANRHCFEVGRSWYRSVDAAAGLTRDALDSFYDLLEDVMLQYNIAPELMWAMDETGFSRNKPEADVVKVKGTKQHQVGKEQASHISLVGAVSALGRRTPLFLLLKGQGSRLRKELFQGLPLDAATCFTRRLPRTVIHPLRCLILCVALPCCSQGVAERAVVFPLAALVRLDRGRAVP